MNDVLYNIYCFCSKFIHLILEPYLFVRTYLAPQGSIFLAYDYSIEYKEVNGKMIALFAKDLIPHRIFDEQEISLPIKNSLRMAGFNNVFTDYTNKHFFIDTDRNILYLKKMDLAFWGNYYRSSYLAKYLCKRLRTKYAAEVLSYFTEKAMRNNLCR